jgi:Ca2+-binding EF-hand superfamily protein
VKKAFEYFDTNGDGKIQRKEFREVLPSLNLNLTLTEIDEIFSMISTQNDDTLSQEDFCNTLDNNIKNRRLNVANEIEESLFKKIS